MNLTSEKRDELIYLVRKKYPKWIGFHDASFRRHEIQAKRSTVKKASSLLSESKLAQLLVTRDTEAFLDRLDRLGKATQLLMTMSDDVDHGDMEILYVRTLDKPVFCAQIYHLLHGNESIHERLDAYLKYVEEHELPNTWTFPTYLLQFCFPDTELFIEPQSTSWLLKFFGRPSRLGKPSVQTYRTVKNLAYEVKQALSEYQPSDFIDVQSFIQVCGTIQGSNAQANGNVEFNDDLHPNGDGAIPSTFSDQRIEVNNQYNYDDFSTAEDELFWVDDVGSESDPTILTASEIRDASHRLPSTREKRTSIFTSEHSKSNLQETIQAAIGSSLKRLYQDFMNSYMSTPVGVARAVEYGRAREQAELNFSQLIAAHELGETVSDRVFLHLLPHDNAPENQDAGAWIHPTGSESKTLIRSLNKKYPVDNPIRTQIAEVLLEFTRHCVYKADALDKTSEALERLDAVSIIDLPSITPILHALKPNQYILIHEASVQSINRLLGTSYGLNLKELPDLNSSGITLIQTLRDDHSTNRIPSVQDSDLFDIFCHWLHEQGQRVPAIEPAEELDIPDSTDAKPDRTPEPTFRTTPRPPGNDVPRPTPLPTSPPREIPTPKQDVPLWEATLYRKGMIVFHGAAGTEKEAHAQQFATAFAGQSGSLIESIHFSPDITHSVFWGSNPSHPEGMFASFCKEASRHSDRCVFIMNEIDQADLRKIFGGLLHSIGSRSASSARTGNFSLPPNVFIIGTTGPLPMTKLYEDPALCRHFALIQLFPDYEQLHAYHTSTGFQVDELIGLLKQINAAIELSHLHIGTAYFQQKDLATHLKSIWLYEIEPALERAFAHNPQHLHAFRWSSIQHLFAT